MPLAKGIGLGSLQEKETFAAGKPDWAVTTHSQWTSQPGAKSRNPLINKLVTAEKRKKGEEEGCPDHSKVVIPQPGVQNWLKGTGSR